MHAMHAAVLLATCTDVSIPQESFVSSQLRLVLNRSVANGSRIVFIIWRQA